MAKSTVSGKKWKRRALAIMLALSMTAQQGAITIGAEEVPVQTETPATPPATEAPQTNAPEPAQEQTNAPAQEQTNAPAQETNTPAQEQTNAPAQEQQQSNAPETTQEQTNAPAQTDAPAAETTVANPPAGETTPSAPAAVEQPQSNAEEQAETKKEEQKESDAKDKPAEEKETKKEQEAAPKKQEETKVAETQPSSEFAPETNADTPKETVLQSETTPESQTQSESSSEGTDAHDKDDEKKTEKESEQKETEEKLATSPLTYQGDGIDAALSFGSDVKLPEGTALTIREFSGDSYKTSAEAAMKALGLTEITESRYFQIELTKDGKDGKDVKAENGNVDLQINFHKNTISHADDQVYAGLFDAAKTASLIQENEDKSQIIGLGTDSVVTSINVKKFNLANAYVVALIGGKAPETEMSESEPETLKTESEKVTESETEAVKETEAAVVEETETEAEDISEPEEATGSETVSENDAEDGFLDETEEELTDETEEETESETEVEYLTEPLRYRGSDYTVTVFVDESAKLPKNSTVDAKEIAQGTAEYEALLAQAHNAMGITDAVEQAVTQARFFDITIYGPNGDIIEPESGVNVVIRYSQPIETANVNDVEMIHFGEYGTEMVDVTARPNNNGDIKNVEFKAESFSPYGVIYTVDFTYKDGYTYHMPGGGQMLLSELFAVLGINENIADVIQVIFTDDTLLSIEKSENDYLLKSLQPFISEETLTIIVNAPETSGVVKYLVDVRDAQGEVPLTDLIQTNGITVTLDESSHQTEYARNATVGLNISYRIDDSKLGNAKQAECWVYDLSKFVSENPLLNLGNMADGYIMDGKIIAGTYEIKNNKVYLKVDPKWLSPKTTNVQGTFNLSVGLDAEKVKTMSSYTFEFPGAAVGPTIEFKEVHVTHEKTVDGNSWNNVVTVTKGADGKYKLHYRLKVSSDSYLNNLSVTDTLTGSQKLISDSIKVTVGYGGTAISNVFLSSQNEKMFTLDLLKTLNNAGSKFTPGIDYYVEYDVTIPQDKIGKVDSNGTQTSDSEAEGNTATWSWDGNSTSNSTEVYTKTKKEITKSVVESESEVDGKTETVLTYTITIGDAETDFAGHTISDKMINLQDLNDTNIVITNGDRSWSGNANVTWTKQAQYSNSEVEVFNYSFSEKDHVYGPLTITYSTTVAGTGEVPETVKGNLWVGNKVSDNYPEGEKN